MSKPLITYVLCTIVCRIHLSVTHQDISCPSYEAKTEYDFGTLLHDFLSLVLVSWKPRRVSSLVTRKHLLPGNQEESPSWYALRNSLDNFHFFCFGPGLRWLQLQGGGGEGGGQGGITKVRPGPIKKQCQIKVGPYAPYDKNTEWP